MKHGNNRDGTIGIAGRLILAVIGTICVVFGILSVIYEGLFAGGHQVSLLLFGSIFLIGAYRGKEFFVR